MSNRKKWAKTIKFTHLFRKDKLFKSYWVRKFLNKISIISKSYKTEKFLFNCLHTIKKLQVNNYQKQNQNTAKFLFNKNFKKLGFDFKFVKIFKKRSVSSKFRKLKFRKFKYQSYVLKDNLYKYKKNIRTSQVFILGKRFRKNISLHFKNRTYFINNNRKLRSNKITLPNNFLVFNKNQSLNKTQFSLYCRSNNKIFRKDLEERKHIPISYILRMIDYSRWIFTTQLRRLGKYFHNIPTVITFPRTHNFGIKKLAFALKFSRKFNNFQQKFSVEILNILFRPRKSYSRRLRRQKFKIVKKNAPYANFRWK